MTDENNNTIKKKLTFGVFDIETYRDFFVFVLGKYDEDGKRMSDDIIVPSKSCVVRPTDTKIIEAAFNSVDYIISFNGVSFDIPILAKICSDVKRHGFTSTRYIYADGQSIINYDANRNYRKFHAPIRADWHAKHFDIFRNSLLSKSLKQWEMYSGYRIEELPYAVDAVLSRDEKDKIIKYCQYDVYSTARIFFNRCYGNTKNIGAVTTFLAYREMVAMYPKDLPNYFDRTSTSLAEGYLYGTRDKLPPTATSPLQLINFDQFDVDQGVKDLIAEIANPIKYDKKIKYSYKGINFGKGGAHFIRKGKWKDIHEFDVASMYPSVIEFWRLLKTDEANDKYIKTKYDRLTIKHTKGLEFKSKALKRFLNGLSGAFRGKGHTAYDPAVGEAMCYISQMIITEAALSCPDFDNVVEVNTDSVFVVGDANIKHLREFTKKLKAKYNIVLEEEVSPCCYFRDVNNYGVYDENEKFITGKGMAYSDTLKKGHNLAVNREMFDNLVRDKLSVDWDSHLREEFIYKYHKAASSKYAYIGDDKMSRKNYYFIWTTRDCPNSYPISFARTLIDTHNGSIKARYGVYAFDPADFNKYYKYLDYTQYQKDLDDAFELWGRSDLCTTRVSKTDRKGVKSLTDVMRAFF